MTSFDALEGFLEAPTRATVLDFARILRIILSLLANGGILLMLVLVPVLELGVGVAVKAIDGSFHFMY